MKIFLVFLMMVCVLLISVASADTFGTGTNQFSIDFVTISGDTNPTGNYGFVQNDYRMGVYEITNDQWDKFKAAYGTVTGSPSNAYNKESYFTGSNIPANSVSWYEALQFVNWLNTSTGHHAAYNFTGTPGTSDYTFATWSASDADGENVCRHKDAFYFLPTEYEWGKAAYWNGSKLQYYTTPSGLRPDQGDGVSGTGWNYCSDLFNNGYATDSIGPWAVGSGSEELNGTFDMMGNVFEWVETLYDPSDDGYGVDVYLTLRGGSYYHTAIDYLAIAWKLQGYPNHEDSEFGFRVASKVPEPATLSLLGLGALALLNRRK